MNAPCDLPFVAPTNQQILPKNLSLIYGKPTQNRRTEKDRKIVLYILAADDSHKNEKLVLNSLYEELQVYCECRGFELQLCDAHAKCDNFLDPTCWIDEPLEARGGHHLAVECLSEILSKCNVKIQMAITQYFFIFFFLSGHSSLAYIVPVLLLGTTLGSPLLPLTIENQDFVSAFSSTAEGSDEKKLLERWYILDDKAEPPCYRLKTKNITANAETGAELENLYKSLVDVFSKELRDSYLTSVIEQEINNTVLISQELSKRCIWVHTGILPGKQTDAMSSEISVVSEMNRRLNHIQLDLKVSQ